MRVHRGLVLSTLLFALIACGPDGADDSTAGTGSSGGNPAQVGFALGQSPIGARWDVMTLNVDRVEVFRFDDAGDCLVDDASTRVIGRRLSLRFDRLDALDLDDWCRVRVTPPVDEALVLLAGPTRLGSFDVSLFRAGLDLDVVVADAAETTSLVVEFEPARIIGALDLAALPEVDGRRIIDDADPDIADRVSMVISDTIVVYADPTPDTPGLTRSEREAADPIATGAYSMP